MKHKSTKTALRWFFRLEVVCLCVTLAGVGVCVAAERTAYIAQGAPASVQAEFAPLLPAPLGNLAAVIMSIRNISKNDVADAFVKLHNLFR